jgi:hypothetical protein
MATKAGLLATINGFITAIITQAKHRSSMSAVVDELYQNSVADSSASQIYTTKSGAILLYDVNIHKSGNVCHIKGSIENSTTAFQNAQSVFTWKENQYKFKSTESIISFNAINRSNFIQLSLSNSGLFMNSPIASDQIYDFDYKFYLTQD